MPTREPHLLGHSYPEDCRYCALCTVFIRIFYSIIPFSRIESSLVTQSIDKPMTKRNSLISVFLSIILLSAIVLLTLSVLRRQELNTTSQEMAIDFTQQILSLDPETQVPNVQALLDNAYSTLLQRRSTESSTAYIAMVFRTLGELELIESISGASKAPLLLISDELPTAYYQLNTVFANGSSTVEIRMVFDQDRWFIEDFTVESNLMVI